MSKNRKSTRGKQPITAHPLFPAVVALWFGALFGLGSLAIRVGLLESLVLASHIDSVIPAAAPPLGVTARILLALCLAALGAVIGLFVARALTGSKADADGRRPAKRAAPAVKVRARDAHPDAPARRPISAHEEFGDEDEDENEYGDDSAALADDRGSLFGRRTPAHTLAAAAAEAPGSVPVRRRGLTINDDAPRQYHDLAPLPGGGAQILDISEFEITADDAVPTGADDHAVNALDLALLTPAPDFAPAPRAFDAVSEAEDETPVIKPFAAPFDAPVLDEGNRNAPFAPPHTFQPAPTLETVRAPFAPPSAGLASHDGSDDYVAPANAPRRFSAPPADHVKLTQQPVDDGRPRMPEPAEVPYQPAGSSAVFALPFTAPPLFGGPGRSETADQREDNAPEITAEAEGDDVVAVAAEIALDTPAESADLPRSLQLPAGSAAERITSAHLDALSPVELIERLALSLQRRRDIADAERAIAASTVMTASPAAPLPEAVAEPAPVPFATPPIFSTPLSAAPDIDILPEVPAAPIAMPAALRPISFDDIDGDAGHDEALASLLPPRHLASVAEPASLASVKTVTTVDELDEDDDGYSSLLDIDLTAPPPRAGFVRVEEPVQADDTIEPVVIFPGQGAGHAGPAYTGPASAPMQMVQPTAVSLGANEANSATSATAQAAALAEQKVLRRFDAPGSSGVLGQEVHNAAPIHDPEETDRALRAALATLQRMSGAA